MCTMLPCHGTVCGLWCVLRRGQRPTGDSSFYEVMSKACSLEETTLPLARIRNDYFKQFLAILDSISSDIHLIVDNDISSIMSQIMGSQSQVLSGHGVRKCSNLDDMDMGNLKCDKLFITAPGR